MTDEDFMRRALELAMRGAGWVNPNPLVGAVIVRDGRIIGEGWHPAYGQLHAERYALADCRQRGEDPRGATIYVTLEPCCHTGKTPPCTEALIEAGIARVVMGAPDPNPKVAGGGIAQLEQAGIEVVQGVLTQECLAINAAFLHYIQTRKPYVIVKYAMTMDGKIATRTGASRWVTGPAARRRVHEDRQRYAAIMVGVNTVIKDDPLLTCRLDEFAAEGAQASETPAPDQAFMPAPSNPARIICDTHLRTPLDSRIVKTAGEILTYIATAESDQSKHAPYLEAGCTVLVVPEEDGHVSIPALMEQLGAASIDSVIVEGGAALNWSVLASGVAQKLQCYIAPKIFGGGTAPSPVAGLGAEEPANAIKLGTPSVTRLGDDLLLECEVR